MLLFIPTGTTRPCWRRPYVTYALIAANALVFTMQHLLEDSMAAAFVPARPSLATWFASMFMHGGIMHLLGNMLFLWLFATLTEDVFGPALLLGFYLAGNLGATLLHIAVGAAYAPGSLEVPVVGASGAIAGIMGVAAACFLKTKVRIWYLFGWWWFLYWRAGTSEIAAPVALGLWAAWEVLQGMVSTWVQAAFGAGGGVAHWAHVGGFAVGLGGAFALGLRRRVVRLDLVQGTGPSTGSYATYAQRAELERVTRASPHDAEAWQALGRARETSGDRAGAGEAYAKAVELFLRQQRERDAVAAYRQAEELGSVLALAREAQFRLACALENSGHTQEALKVFLRLGMSDPPGRYAETSLVRAGEIARGMPESRDKAVACYRGLLQRFPHGPWRGLAQERLAELGAREGGFTRGPDIARTEDDGELRDLGWQIQDGQQQIQDGE